MEKLTRHIVAFLLAALAAFLLRPAFAGEFRPGDHIPTMYACQSVDPLMRQSGMMDIKQSHAIMALSLQSRECVLAPFPIKVELAELIARFIMHDGPTELWRIKVEDGSKPLYILLDSRRGSHPKNVSFEI